MAGLKYGLLCVSQSTLSRTITSWLQEFNLNKRAFEIIAIDNIMFYADFTIVRHSVLHLGVYALPVAHIYFENTIK